MLSTIIIIITVLITSLDQPNAKTYIIEALQPIRCTAIAVIDKMHSLDLPITAMPYTAYTWWITPSRLTQFHLFGQPQY